MAKEVKLPIGKRVNIDQKLADRLADYRFARRIGSENQAIRDLLELGLDVAENTGPALMVTKARALLADAIRLQLAPIELGAEAMRDEQDPAKILRKADELLRGDGGLKALEGPGTNALFKKKLKEFLASKASPGSQKEAKNG